MAAALAVSLYSTRAVAQTLPHTVLLTTNRALVTRNLVIVPRGGTNRVATNLVGRGRPFTALPSPLVYRTEPYACIVVVPGSHPDDWWLITPGNRGSDMPVIRPELRFVPVPAK